MGPFKDIGVDKTGHVALVEIRRPPNNFFDVALIRELADAFETLDADPDCRALVLAAQGKAFCAGANFGDDDGSALLSGPTPGAAHLYIEGNRLFRTRKPIVAAVHGAAVGGGLGLGHGGRFSGDLRRSAVLRQLHPARFSSGIWIDRHVAGGRRPDQGGADVLYQPPHRR